jgi:DNA/RNA-binding domain of Phe-tRNA-synthetase-like protein
VNKGRLLAAALVAATLVLIAIGTIWPAPSAAAYAGAASILRPSSTPEAAVENLGDQIRARAWEKAYSSLANKAQFTRCSSSKM